MGDMRKDDAERLKSLIEKHMHYTNSGRAKAILADWPTYLPKFRKVMPVEYAKALEEIARQQRADATGLDELEIGMPLKGKKREEARKR